jgi:hypothetical protein
LPFFLQSRYKVYLEPEEDTLCSQAQKAESNNQNARVPLQERPALAEMSATPLFSQKRRVTTNPTARRKSETHRPSASTTSTSLQQRKAGRRISHGIVTGTNNDCPTGNNPSLTVQACSTGTVQATPCSARVLRMGTRTSLSALHRERLRLTTDIPGIPMPRISDLILSGFPGLKSAALDLDYDTMEYKSIMPDKVNIGSF